MKKIRTKLLILCVPALIFLLPGIANAAGFPVVDVTVAAAVEHLNGTTVANEMARVADAAKEIDALVEQIAKLEQLHSDAMQQYDELMAITTWQGAWDKIGGLNMETPGSLSDALNMYKYNKKTIENVMLDNPVENILNKIEGYEDYLPQIDTEYWEEKTTVDFKQMFRADAVALMMKKDYDDYRDYLYGYKDKGGATIIGEIPTLTERWEKYHDNNYVNIKNAAEKEKAQAYLDSLTAKIESFKKEEQSKKARYEAALAFCNQVKEIRSKVADVRAQYRAGIINSKLKILGNEEIVEKLKKEEEAALSY